MRGRWGLVALTQVAKIAYGRRAQVMQAHQRRASQHRGVR